MVARNGLRMANVVASRYLGRPPRYLPILLLFITDRCNLRCQMCGVCEHEASDGGDVVKPPELTTDEWKGVIRSGVKLGTMLVSVGGGEPLLRPDLFEILRYVRHQGLASHICSNGVLLDREKAAALAECGVNTVSISIESPHREIHERLRGEGSFEPAVRAVRLLREVAPSVQIGINYLITTVNFRNMAEMIPFAESLGVQQLKYAPIHTNLLHRRKRLDHFGSLLFGEEDIEELGREVDDLIVAAKKSDLVTTSTMFLSGITALYSAPRRFRCFAGYAAVAINPAGIVTPCCDMDGTVSVRDKPLEAIWRSKEFQELRRRVHHCNSSCWDTTNAELSLRLRPTALVGELVQTWRDVRFYYDRG